MSGKKSKKVIKNSKKQIKTKSNMSSTYEKTVLEPWFSLISNGVKTVEGRPKKGFFDKLKKNDIVIWTNNMTGKDRKCKTKITDVRYYNTFYDMIDKEGLDNVLPAPGVGIKSVSDGVSKVYRQWYSAEIEKKYGVCAIEMKVLE